MKIYSLLMVGLLGYASSTLAAKFQCPAPEVIQQTQLVSVKQSVMNPEKYFVYSKPKIIKGGFTVMVQELATSPEEAMQLAVNDILLAQTPTRGDHLCIYYQYYDGFRGAWVYSSTDPL